MKQLRLSFINGPDLVSAMASKALIDLVTWHGPQELDQAIGTEPSDANYEKTKFAPVDISDLNDDDLNVGVLSILFSGFHKDDWEFSPEGDNHDNVPTILGEGFAKILLLSENYPSISADLHPVILAQLVRLYFLEESKELGRSITHIAPYFFQFFLTHPDVCFFIQIETVPFSLLSPLSIPFRQAQGKLIENIVHVFQDILLKKDFKLKLLTIFPFYRGVSRGHLSHS